MIAAYATFLVISQLGPGADISFEAVDDEVTQLSAIMQSWHDEELKRQGGKFKSHGWWPWGLRAFDYDRDGDLDLVASHHGKPGSAILKSHFRETGKLRFSNVTKELGVESRDLPGADDRPWIWDIDGDGYLDIAGMSDESTAPVMLNQQGRGFAAMDRATFKPLAHPREIVDINGDGFLDVDGGYRGQWFYQPKTKTFRRDKTPRLDHSKQIPAGIRDSLVHLKSKKNNRFLRSVAMTHTIVGYDTLGYSPTPIDLNADGIDDMVIQTSGGYGADYLGHYLLGSKNGSHVEASESLRLPNAGAPIWIDDLTGDRFPDILIAGKETGGVYIHDGKQGYERRENELTDFLRKRGPYLLRAFRIDADNDSDWDLVMTNPRLGRVELYSNDGDGKFTRKLTTRGWDSNSVVVADINDDGKMDIVVGTRSKSNQASIQIFTNTTNDVGNYCRVRLKMPSPNPYTVGAVVEATRTGESKPFFAEKAHCDGTPIHIGLGESNQCSLTVRFPDDRVQSLPNMKSGTEILVDHATKQNIHKK